jgi:anti-sigma regulatory factor (Ser/Thr protein kinase)
MLTREWLAYREVRLLSISAAPVQSLQLSAGPENGIVCAQERGHFQVAGPAAWRMPPEIHRERNEKATHSHSQLLLRLHLESNPDALCMVRAAVQRATEILHFQEPEVRAIVRSVDEALANVIRHAYKGKEGMPIEVSCNRLCRDEQAHSVCGIEILLEDSGEMPDIEKLRARSLDEVRPGGLGLHFMKQSMDVVEFRRSNDKNVLRMVKYLATPKPGEKPEGV